MTLILGQNGPYFFKKNQCDYSGTRFILFKETEIGLEYVGGKMDDKRWVDLDLKFVSEGEYLIVAMVQKPYLSVGFTISAYSPAIV